MSYIKIYNNFLLATKLLVTWIVVTLIVSVIGTVFWVPKNISDFLFLFLNTYTGIVWVIFFRFPIEMNELISSIFIAIISIYIIYFMVAFLLQSISRKKLYKRFIVASLILHILNFIYIFTLTV